MTEGINENANAQERANAIRRNSMVILDQLNTIENRSAATMEQITFVMNQFASQAHLANEEIKSMAALSAVMIETGEEQGKGGRALKMMYARLGSDIGGARQEMERLDVAVVDANGDMRPLSDMLMQLEERFMDLDGAEQQATAQIIAGNRHYTRFLKLMTNLDRVKELEFEATLRMFPAMDEIQRRRDNELFQLEQSEANVRNLSAALGEQLLPAMTEISEKQAIFLQTIVALNEGPLGGMITGMLALSKSATVLVGPVLNTIINFKNMSIALQTHAAITRALNKEQELLNISHLVGNRVSQDMAQTYNFQQQAIENINQTRTVESGILEHNNDLYMFSNEELEEMFQKLQREIPTTKDLADQKQKLAEARRINNELVVREATEIEKKALKDKAEIDLAKQKAQAFNGITMAMAGTGSMLMLFGKSQRAMRMGMVLNTAAMGAQIIAMIHKNREQTKDLFLTMSQSIAQARMTITTQLQTTATFSLAGAFRAATAGIVGLKAGMIGLAKASGPFILLLGASYGITHLLEKLGVFADDAADSVSDFSAAMADTGVVLEMLEDESMTLAVINDQLKEKEGLLANVADSTSELGKITEQSLRAEIANLTLAREIRQLGDIEATKAAAEDLFGLGPEKDELSRKQKMRNLSMGRFPQFMRGMRSDKEAREHNKKLIKAQEELQENFPVLFSFIQEHEVENMVQLEKVIDEFYQGIETRAKDNVMAIVDDVGVGVDAIEDFTNAREELFFGSRSNMTGDLIKQVQQQGVENLITSTEVVMTNVFNGLTIPEMADIVIEEIEGRGRLNGYNITAS
jgi:hypothetical protein